jgi:phage-related minor tail protein
MIAAMLDFVLRPLRSALGVAEHEAASPFEATEREIIEAAEAMRRAAASIEHHVEVVEGLATAVGPLTESVNHLTATMAELVTLLAPMATAEREVAAVRRRLGFHRQAKPVDPRADPPA